MVSIIRDYLDVIAILVNSSAGYFDYIRITFLLFVQFFTTFVHYFVTFAWFRDIMYLPLLIPKCQQAVLSEHFFYQDLNVPFFLQSLSVNQGLLSAFFLGVLNSFFCCLPLSTIHLLNIRRLFVQGLLAGAVSTAGMIFGQVMLIFCTIFGLRSLIIPWFSLDPWTSILGFCLLLTVVYGMANETRIRPVDSSEKGVLLNIFFVSFILSWTEQAGFGQLITNLNLTNQPSLFSLQGTTAFSHFGYFFGILFGHILFSVLFLGLSFLVKDGLFILSKLPYSVWLNRVNSVLLMFIIGLSCSSIPYYSLDYLVTGPLGFVSQDKTLENSIFAQRNIKDPSRLLTSMDVMYPFPIDTDISYFDRGNYGEQPGYFQRSFEDLNYQGEYAWLVRRDKKPNLYSSAQTTRTAIRDLFQFEPTPNAPANVNSQAQQESNIREAKKKLLVNSMSSKKSTSMDRPRFKKRYDETYQETRLNDSFLIGESFNSFPVLEGTPTPLEIALKQKYYSNRVYQALLNMEVDAFLNRQPKSYILTPEEELLVHQKRLLLAKYHDTIREYQNLPYKDEFNEFFQGSKSFVDRAYNHQFKGNLGTVRRLFAVTFDDEDNPSKNAVLKYDQPLFRDSTKSTIFHEELSSFVNPKKTPFLESNDSTPFYLGWDNETRQMILTKRFAQSLDEINVDLNFGAGNETPEFQKFLKNPLESKVSSTQTLNFITWPLEKRRVLEFKETPKFSNEVITLFEPFSNLENSPIAQVISTGRGGSFEVFSFPANMRFFGKVPERLAPNHGGLVWPGNIY